MDSAGTFSVLIVEDNDDAAESLATVFRMYGHDARTASCGETALRLAREARPDAVVLDLGLPGMDGFAVAGELLALAPPRPLLIAVSGHTGLRTECLAAGIDYYLHKPADPAVLGALIHAHSAAASESRAGGRGEPQHRPE